ncbi:MAG: tRNA (N6-isopentenyl adenosine(37)-C2)-methylthiotransferase MiaB [Coriobacteriales bacterium]
MQQTNNASEDRPLAGMTYWQRTFGCQMNENDAERVAGMLEEAGALPVLTIEDADIAIFLTCCVREKAELRLMGQVASIKNVPDARGAKRIIVVGGCIGQLDGPDLREELSHVDVVFGTHNLGHLVDLIERRIVTGEPQVETIEVNDGFASDLPVRRAKPWHAWVPIMTGCDNFCTYCIVPYVRGREMSRPMEDIENELVTLADDGIREITLLGQNVNSYGRDLYGEPRFAQILALAGESGVDRVRFVTSHPKDLLPETIEAMASYPNIMPQLHLPLQSGSDRILRAMNRSYTVERYLGLVHDVREAIPGHLPFHRHHHRLSRETEEDFQGTLDVVKEVGYGQMFRFIYSKRPGTPAATMVDDTSSEVLQGRFERLERLAQESSLAENEHEIGKTISVLVEGVSKRDADILAGKSPKLQTVHARLADGTRIEDMIGGIVTVHVDSATTNYLQGTLV